MEKIELDVVRPRVTLIAAGENYGRFAIGTLERGHASPLGNALRRVLVSSIPGAAISRVKIGRVIHEFSTIPGVLEDGTQLILNIKGIRLRCYAERPVALQLIKRGPGPVYASDIDAPSTVEIVNPQHYLCTLDDDSTLEMQLTAERGRGVTLADNVSGLNIGEVAVDALFSPIPRVNFIVEPQDEGERLILEIWTDGTVKPGDALSHAAQILSQHFGRVAAISEPQEVAELPATAASTIPPEIYDRPIDELGLSTRTYNSLRRADITTIGKLLELDDRALNSIRNLGPKSAEEIRERLIVLGYRGGTPGAIGAPADDDSPSDDGDDPSALISSDQASA